jgi:hypothetical protein
MMIGKFLHSIQDLILFRCIPFFETSKLAKTEEKPFIMPRFSSGGVVIAVMKHLRILSYLLSEIA